MTRAMPALAVACLLLAASGADARPRHVHAHSTVIVCNKQGCSDQYRRTVIVDRVSRRRIAMREDVSFISNPSGCRRVYLSCACRLAAYWGLGSGLDKVSTWPRLFARVSSPAVGVAAVRHDQHHIIGIIGGGPGAWRVADFNSGGHRNREYTVADFRGYFFVDPRTRTASR